MRRRIEENVALIALKHSTNIVFFLDNNKL